MAMNKKEKAAFEDLQRQLHEAQALRFTEYFAPDVLPPDSSSKLVKGWLTNTYSCTVARACTNAVHHSFDRDDKTTSQGARYLYSTELLAMRALRRWKEKEFAAALAKLDQRISELKTIDDQKPPHTQ